MNRFDHLGGCSIRIASPEDAPALLAVYAPYVRRTAVTFEYDAPSVPEFEDRIRKVLSRYPYLVAEKEGRPVGYAYAGPFHSRAAYGWGVETSLYLAWDFRRQGIGRALHEALAAVLREQHILNLNACVARPQGDDPYLTEDSIRFHQRMGYRMVGEFFQCGYKFGRWYNMVWMEKHLGEHPAVPLPVIPFEEIRERISGLYGF